MVREKLVELLMHDCCPNNDGCDFCKYGEAEHCRAEYLADHLIANGVTVQEWISVKDRLPYGEELVMIHCKNGAMFVGYCGKQYCDYERRRRIKTALNSTKLLNLGRVTHWMSLPEPPKED